MAKNLVRKLKLTIEAGKASAASPVGPTLGQAKVNIGEFISRFNQATVKRAGEPVPVEVRVYDDKTFELNLKQPLVSYLIKKAAGIEKGSGKNLLSKAGSISRAQLKEIAEKKMPDLNANDINAALRIVEGSAVSMGVEIK